MKAVHLFFKRELMEFKLSMYIIWMTGVAIGAYSYLNVPAWIIPLGDVYSFFREVFKFSWSMIIVFISGMVMVFASKLGGRIWTDYINPAYEKRLKKSKTKRRK